MRDIALGSCLMLAACASQPPSRPTMPAAPVADSPDALGLHFQAITGGLRGEGLHMAGLFERGFLPPGGRAAYPVRVPARSCAVFVALGTSNVADLDAAVYTAEGVALVEDDSANARPSLTLCARDAPLDAYLTLHAYQGAGSYIAAQFVRPARGDDDLQTVSAASSVSALGQLAQTLHERGFEDAAPRVQITLGDARPVRLAVNVAAGECYTLAAEGGEGLAELSLRLVDSEGGELANGLAELHLAALQYCASSRAELVLEVSAKRGQGVASVGRFRAAQALVGGTRALWLGEPMPSAAAWLSPRPVAEKRAGTPDLNLRKPTQVPLRQGELIELPPVSTRGRCQRWEATLAPGLWRATLRVESEQGTLLAEADSAHLRACVQICGRPGAQRVSLLGRAGFGSVVLRGTYLPESGAAPTDCASSSGRR